MHTYVTEKERFFSKNWLGAKKLESVHAYVYESLVDYHDAASFGLQGTLREYNASAWKDLMSRENMFYRANKDVPFAHGSEERDIK